MNRIDKTLNVLISVLIGVFGATTTSATSATSVAGAVTASSTSGILGAFYILSVSRGGSLSVS